MAEAKSRTRVDGAGGRPPISVDIERARALLAAGMSVGTVARAMGVARTTLYRRLGILEAPGRLRCEVAKVMVIGPGPKPSAAQLKRDLRLFSQRRNGSSLEELMKQSRLGKPAVLAAIETCVGRLPGSWDLVFAPAWSGKGWQRQDWGTGRGRKPQVRPDYEKRGGNASREATFPLKPELYELCESGARDPLIGWLYEHGLKSMERLHRLTGVHRDRIRGIINLRLNRVAAALLQEIQARMPEGPPLLAHKDGVPFLERRGLGRDEAFQLIKDRDGRLWRTEQFSDLQGKPAVLLPAADLTPAWLKRWAEERRAHARTARRAAWSRVPSEERRAISQRGVLTIRRKIQAAASATAESHRRIIAEIQRRAGEAFAVPPAQLCSKARSKRVALARQVAMAVARRLTGDSYTSIGRDFGQGTVRHDVLKIEALLTRDAGLRETVERITTALRTGEALRPQIGYRPDDGTSWTRLPAVSCDV
jgi:hypothetical protein